jgi:hypothetical protein
MKRYTGVRVLTQSLLDVDLAIYIGEGICKEAFPYANKGRSLFFSDEQDYLISIALGIAMCTDKRVFVFCEDQYIIRNLSECINAGVSACKNFFILLFFSNRYTVVDNTPTAFSSVNSQIGLFYNLGFLVHNHSIHFKNSNNPLRVTRAIYKKIKGPMIVFLSTEKGIKKLPEIKFSSKEDLINVQNFIQDEEIRGYNFVPPISLEDLKLEV